jgi:hypothetical protein
MLFAGPVTNIFRFYLKVKAFVFFNKVIDSAAEL